MRERGLKCFLHTEQSTCVSPDIVLILTYFRASSGRKEFLLPYFCSCSLWYQSHLGQHCGLWHQPTFLAKLSCPRSQTPNSWRNSQRRFLELPLPKHRFRQKTLPPRRWHRCHSDKREMLYSCTKFLLSDGKRNGRQKKWRICLLYCPGTINRVRGGVQMPWIGASGFWKQIRKTKCTYLIH